jgi:hypothetical protein
MNKLVTMILLLIFGGFGLWYVAYRAATTQQKRAATKDGQVVAPSGKLTEEQRLVYVQQHIVVSEIQLVPDTKPDSDEVVPGLFRVSGVVVNNGDRKIDLITLTVHPENAAGEVIGTYNENIAGAKGLEPGAKREFKFQVPEKKEYGGRFRHTVR